MNKTRTEWEKDFITALVRFRDYFLDLEGLSQIGPQKAFAVNNLVSGYFSERRNRVGIPEASCYMTNEDIAFYINDIVLDFVSYEHAGFLELDWRDKYILKSEENDIRLDSYGEDGSA